MINHTATPRISSWYSLLGPDRDIVIASNVNVDRNLVGFPFIHLCSDEDTVRLRKTIDGALYAIDEDLTLIDGESLGTDLRTFYEERGILIAGDRPGITAVTASQDGMIRIGAGEHLRVSGFAGGFQLNTAAVRTTGLDTQLEEHLEYAVSIKLGYLAADIQRVGTGLFATTLLHLPAIEHSEGFQLGGEGHPGAVSHQGAQHGENRVVLSRYGGEASGNGSLYTVSCIAEFGESEEETLAMLAGFTERLVHYEREARNELVRRHGDELADTAGRALGTLRHARRLTADETMDLLSVLRLGVSLGYIDEVELSTVSDLLFVGRDSQVRVLVEDKEAPIDVARATLVRRTLGSLQDV